MIYLFGDLATCINAETEAITREQPSWFWRSIITRPEHIYFLFYAQLNSLQLAYLSCKTFSSISRPIPSASQRHQTIRSIACLSIL